MRKYTAVTNNSCLYNWVFKTFYDSLLTSQLKCGRKDITDSLKLDDRGWNPDMGYWQALRLENHLNLRILNFRIHICKMGIMISTSRLSYEATSTVFRTPQMHFKLLLNTYVNK